MSKEMHEYLITFVCLGNSYCNKLYHPDKDIIGITTARLLHPSRIDQTEVGEKIIDCMRRSDKDLPEIIDLLTKDHEFVDADKPPKERYITTGHAEEYRYSVPINMPGKQPRDEFDEDEHPTSLDDAV